MDQGKWVKISYIVDNGILKIVHPVTQVISAPKMQDGMKFRMEGRTLLGLLVGSDLMQYEDMIKTRERERLAPERTGAGFLASEGSNVSEIQ